MDKEELLAFLKENLVLEVNADGFDFDKMRVTVSLSLGQELITRDSDWFTLPQG